MGPQAILNLLTIRSSKLYFSSGRDFDHTRDRLHWNPHRFDSKSMISGRPVSRVLCPSLRKATAISLGRRSPGGSSSLPGGPNGRCHPAPCLALLPVGFTLPARLPAPRCALTAPLHPYLLRGGIFSVALSLSLRTAGVTCHRALWSPDFPPSSAVGLRPCRRERPSGRPEITHYHIGESRSLSVVHTE